MLKDFPSNTGSTNDGVFLITSGSGFDLEASSTYKGYEDTSKWRLGGTTCWAAETSSSQQVLKLVMTEPKLVYGIVTTGRGDVQHKQWVTGFTVQSSKNGVDFCDEGRFKGNKDNLTPRLHFFRKPKFVSEITLSNFTWSTHVSCRVGIIVRKGE